jgi:hypothetical protein
MFKCRDFKEPEIDSASLSSLAGRYDKESCHSGPPGWESISVLVKRFTNTGSGIERISEKGLQDGSKIYHSWFILVSFEENMRGMEKVHTVLDAQLTLKLYSAESTPLSLYPSPSHV